MKTSPIKQNILHLIIILIVIGICLWANPSPKDHVHGIFLPATSSLQEKPIQVSQVSVFNNQFPQAYKDMGTIRTALHYSTTSEKQMEQDVKRSVAYAKELAAKHGANAVVLTNVGRTTETGPLDGVIVYAQAIHI